jgi:hypothetical protein
VDGLDKESWTKMLVAASLAAAAGLTKYFGAALIPLLCVYTIIRGGRRWVFLIALVIPVGAYIGFDFWTRSLYQRGLFFGAASYSQSTRSALGVSWIFQLLITASYLGGSAVSGLVLAPRLWSPTVLAGGLLGAGILAQMVGIVPGLLPAAMDPRDPDRWVVLIQLGVWIVAGFHLAAVIGRDLWRSRTAEGVLLFLWIAGTVVFAGMVNWSVNARSLLPAVPGLAIVLFRWPLLRNLSSTATRLTVGAGLTAAAALSLAAAVGDDSFARAARQAAELAQKSADEAKIRPEGRWYQGHWGFQWYIQKQGWRPLLLPEAKAEPGDVVAMQFPNTNIAPLNPAAVGPTSQTLLPLYSLPSTIDVGRGTSFYSSQGAVLPFLFEVRANAALDLVPLRAEPPGRLVR